MRDQATYLRGLRDELRGAEATGRENVVAIRAEIARVEKLLSSRAYRRSVERAVVPPDDVEKRRFLRGR